MLPTKIYAELDKNQNVMYTWKKPNKKSKTYCRWVSSIEKEPVPKDFPIVCSGVVENNLIIFKTYENFITLKENPDYCGVILWMNFEL